MRKMLLAGLAALGIVPLAAGDREDPQQAIEALNVNARYTVDGVHLQGAKMARLSRPLRSELDQVVGEKLNQSRLDKLADRIKKELHVADVSVKVAKGATPDHVTVEFDIKESHKQDFDLSLARFLYNSKLGWTGDSNATFRVDGNAFSFGLVDDGDTLVERFEGFHASYARENLGTDRLRLRFDFSSYHQLWNWTTLAAAGPGDIYKTRQNFSPLATVVLAEPLELSFGADFARVQGTLGGTPGPAAGFAAETGGPSGPAAKTESSNAVVSTLRYHRRWGSDKDRDEQDVRASYSLRAGTHVLNSDSVFVRHLAEARYKYRHVHNAIEIAFDAGRIVGAAPLFERFVGGNSVILRGWNKFELDPLGVSHIVHGSLDYTWRGFLVFYDTGAVWDRPSQREQKQSLGTGFKSKEGFQLAVAFPLRAGRADPVFYAGLNF